MDFSGYLTLTLYSLGILVFLAGLTYFVIVARQRRAEPIEVGLKDKPIAELLLPEGEPTLKSALKVARPAAIIGLPTEVNIKDVAVALSGNLALAVTPLRRTRRWKPCSEKP